MKIFCKNCERSVREPRSNTWKEGYCPKCHFIAWDIESTINDDILNIKGGKNPIDMYWHLMTLRELDINDNR